MRNYEEQSRQHFNRQASEYDENTSTYFSGPAKLSCEDVLLYLEHTPYDTLLDVGCGTGWLLDCLSKQQTALYCGLDISEGMLAQADYKNIPNATFTLGSASELPYEDETFDVVTCVQSFHHYPDTKKAMEEAYRVLKKGGIYILSDTGVGGFAAWIDNHILFKLLKSGDCETDNRHGIAKKMTLRGFEIIRSNQLKGFIYTVVGKK